MYALHEYYRNRISFLLEKLSSVRLSLIQTNMIKLITKDFHPESTSFYIVSPANIDSYVKILKEGEKSSMDPTTGEPIGWFDDFWYFRYAEANRTCFWWDQLLSSIWHASTEFLQYSIPWTTLPAKSKLYHVSNVQFNSSNLPNRFTNYFMIDDKFLSFNAETVALYQEAKNPLLTKEKLFMNEFHTVRDLKLISLNPRFNVHDALIYFKIQLEEKKIQSKEMLQDADFLNDNICSKMLLSDLYTYLYLYFYLYGPKENLLSNITIQGDGISMFGHTAKDNTMQEIVLCSKTILTYHKIQLVKTLPYNDWVIEKKKESGLIV